MVRSCARHLRRCPGIRAHARWLHGRRRSRRDAGRRRDRPDGRHLDKTARAMRDAGLRHDVVNTSWEFPFRFGDVFADRERSHASFRDTARVFREALERGVREGRGGLGWGDAREILAFSALPIGSDSPGWIVNEAEAWKAAVSARATTTASACSTCMPPSGWPRPGSWGGPRRRHRTTSPRPAPPWRRGWPSSAAGNRSRSSSPSPPRQTSGSRASRCSSMPRWGRSSDTSSTSSHPTRPHAEGVDRLVGIGRVMFADVTIRLDSTQREWARLAAAWRVRDRARAARASRARCVQPRVCRALP